MRRLYREGSYGVCVVPSFAAEGHYSGGVDILGDFLDNMIPHMDENLFYKYYSDLASAVRVLNHTVVFVVKTDIHSEVDINVVKHFADVIIENRVREEKGRLVREVRISNRVDNIHTDWEKY